MCLRVRSASDYVVGTLDTVSDVSPPSGGTEVPSGIANMSSNTISPAVPQQVGEMDLSSLSADLQCQVRSLLGQYTSFSLPFQLMMEIWVVLTSPWLMVFRSGNTIGIFHPQHMRSQVILESSSAYASPIVLLRKLWCGGVTGQ